MNGFGFLAKNIAIDQSEHGRLAYHVIYPRLKKVRVLCVLHYTVPGRNSRASGHGSAGFDRRKQQALGIVRPIQAIAILRF